MQSYYALRANEYDRVYLKPERQADLRQIEQWLPSVLAGATVLEVVQRRQRPVDHLVARLVVEPSDHGHAARVVLVARVVQAVGLWRQSVDHLRVPVGRRANPRANRT